MNAEEAMKRYKETGQMMTPQETVEMGKEEFVKLFLAALEGDPGAEKKWLTDMAEVYWEGYKQGATFQLPPIGQPKESDG
ncbi:MAG: hypothetical protein ABIH46_11560 [Chloroflexota bacterium]